MLELGFWVARSDGPILCPDGLTSPGVVALQAEKPKKIE